jgi:amino acid adenylation domain-containing protein
MNTLDAQSSSKCIHQLIEQQVQLKPDQPALIFQDQHLTYRELNDRANQVGHYLVNRGARPEVIVGILLRNGLQAAIAALAVLKAGAALFSLSSREPSLCLNERVRDSDMSLLISTRTTSTGISTKSAEVLYLDELETAISRESTKNIESRVSLNNAASVRYTSGSTGKPKGVINIHRSLTSRLLSGPMPDMQAHDVCATRRVGGSRFFVPLALGARVVILSEDDLRNTTQFSRTLEENGVTSIYIVPSLLRELLRTELIMTPWMKTLRAVTVGGEPLTPSLIVRFKAVLPKTLLINVYGSSEIGTTATLRIASEAPETAWRSLGKPVANTEIYIVDSKMSAAPVGAAGEICVASPHLARGYISQPEETSKSFVPDPFGIRTGGCLFRTGDLGRYNVEGEIEFLGRKDRQVKIRGFRVELGEIESILRDNSQVRECVVTTRGLEEDNRLIAHVVAAGAKPSAERLRDHLRRYLPDYMIPSGFLFLEHLPLTPSGAVDYMALPVGDLHRRDLDTTTYVPAREPTEVTLAAIWADIMELDKVGIHDDFLALGGDSLMALRILGRIQQAFETNLSFSQFIETSTIAGIAVLLKDLIAKGGVEVARDSIPRIPHSDPLPLSFQQLEQLRGEILRQQDSTSFRQTHLPVSLSIVGELNYRLLEDSLSQIIRRHEILRTSYEPVASVGPVIVEDWGSLSSLLRVRHLPWASIVFHSKIHRDPSVNLHITDFSEFRGSQLTERVNHTITDFNAAEFNYSASPLLRSMLIKLGPARHIFCAVMPHLAADKQSISLFAKELLSLYSTYLGIPGYRLPVLRIQYVDFAYWQRRRMERQTEPELPSLPRRSDKLFVRFAQYEPAQAIGLTHLKVGRETLTLTPDMMPRTREFATVMRVTPPMVVFLAFVILLHFTSREAVVSVLITQANRTLPELEDLIGFFASGEQICIDFSENPLLGSLFDQVRQEYSRAAIRQGIWINSKPPVSDEYASGPPHNAFAFEFITGLSLTSPPNLSVSRFRVPQSERPVVAFKLSAEERSGGGFEITAKYCADCFSCDAVQALLWDLRTLVSVMFHARHARIADLVKAVEKELRIAAYSSVASASAFTELLPKIRTTH